jgi:hypothetical protein
VERGERESLRSERGRGGLGLACFNVGRWLCPDMVDGLLIVWMTKIKSILKSTRLTKVVEVMTICVVSSIIISLDLDLARTQTARISTFCIRKLRMKIT